MGHLVLISFRWQWESYIFSAPHIHPSRVSDLKQVPVVTSLPPAVDGHLRCFLRVSVQTIHWRIPKYPDDVQVRLKWWGEEGDGVLFRWSHTKFKLLLFCPRVKSVYQTVLNWITLINFCPYHSLFGRPRDDKATDPSDVSKTFTSVRYAVCSGPKQFSAYLKGILNQLMGVQKYLHCNLQRFWVAGIFYEPVKRAH